MGPTAPVRAPSNQWLLTTEPRFCRNNSKALVRQCRWNLHPALEWIRELLSPTVPNRLYRLFVGCIDFVLSLVVKYIYIYIHTVHISYTGNWNIPDEANPFDVMGWHCWPCGPGVSWSGRVWRFQDSWVFPKIGGKPPKWMVYNGNPH